MCEQVCLPGHGTGPDDDEAVEHGDGHSAGVSGQ